MRELFSICAAAMLFPSAMASAATYDGVTGFSTSNPGAIWSYSYSLNGSVAAIPDYQAPGMTFAEAWWTGNPIPYSGLVWVNDTGSTIIHLSVHSPDNSLGLDPEAYDWVSVDFAAPSAGLYQISAGFLGIDTFQFTHPVSVVRGASTLLSGQIEQYNDIVSFNQALTLAAGEKLSFRVHTGLTPRGGSYSNLSTALRVTVTSVPEPSSWAMMIVGIAGCGAALRVRRRSVSWQMA